MKKIVILLPEGTSKISTTFHWADYPGDTLLGISTVLESLKGEILYENFHREFLINGIKIFVCKSYKGLVYGDFCKYYFPYIPKIGSDIDYVAVIDKSSRSDYSILMEKIKRGEKLTPEEEKQNVMTYQEVMEREWLGEQIL